MFVNGIDYGDLCTYLQVFFAAGRVAVLEHLRWVLEHKERGRHVSPSQDKSHNKNAKQLTWVLFLKAHKAAGCLTSIASAVFTLAAAVRRRVTSGRTNANACIVLFLIQSLDRLIFCLGCFWVKSKKIKPVPKCGPIDLESGYAGGFFPMVLVQIPMCNEKEVYQQSIAAICNLDWPKGKLLIQVLDDSDDRTTHEQTVDGNHG